jgi:hypothetical protein
LYDISIQRAQNIHRTKFKKVKDLWNLEKKNYILNKKSQKKSSYFKQWIWNRIIESYPTIWTNEFGNPTKDTNNKDWDWVVVYPNFFANSCLIFHTSNNFKPMVD